MIGTTLSHFKITAKLGEGGMGEVYRAEDTKLGREVAIKVLAPEYAAFGEAVDRFFREAKAVSELRHPNLIQITDFVDADGGSIEVRTEGLETRIEDLEERITDMEERISTEAR